MRGRRRGGRGRSGGTGRPAHPGPRWRRALRLGFLVGVLVPVPAVLVALTVPGADRLTPLLVPGVVLLRLLPLPTATWPGAVTMLLVAVANGLVVGAAAAAVALLAGRLRR